MTEEQLNEELRAIIAEGKAAIDLVESDEEIMPIGPLGVETLTLARGHFRNQRLPDRDKEETKVFFEGMVGGLLDKVKRTICLKGIPLIDEEEELKKLADQITDSVMDLIPVGKQIIKFLLKKFVKQAVLAILKYLAGLGEDWCDGVVDDLAPLPVNP
jgi:hypothetical protein